MICFLYYTKCILAENSGKQGQTGYNIYKSFNDNKFIIIIFLGWSVLFQIATTAEN